jgi:AcrR family transcriptional regulator
VFAREGFRSTGIDKLVREAGVAKMTLYNHFGGKDELIAEALRRSSEANLERLRAGLRGEGMERALSFFDALGSWFECGDFHGCLFLNAAAEFKDPEHPARREVLAHVGKQMELLEELARGAGASDPRAAAESLMLLAEGAIEMAKVRGCGESAAAAKRAARTLLEAAR